MKLLDLLVKEFPHLGGWPKGVDAVRQNGKGELFGINSVYCSDFKLEKCDDWVTDVVTKQQYESALAASKAVVGHDGWIQWGGGKCPVPSSEVVVVKFRDGRIRDPYRADGYSWSKNGRSDDIIAYRIHKPDIDSRAQYEADIAASDGWIDWHGGNCPVDSDAIVEVKYRKPNPYQFNNDRAGDFTWSHEGVGCDIIAYRLKQPTKSEQDFDDAAGDDDEADLNECIGQGVDMPEWNGDGLPPVGIKCEHCPGGTTQHEWEVVTVAGVHENTSTGFIDYWLVRENGSSYIVGNPYRFRPLRTEAEKLREDGIAEMLKALYGPQEYTYREICELIYDAGYRKENK